MTNKEFIKKKLEIIPVIIAGHKATIEFIELLFQHNSNNIQVTDYLLDNLPQIKIDAENSERTMNQWYLESIEEYKKIQ